MIALVLLGLGAAGCDGAHESSLRKPAPGAGTSPATLITADSGNSFQVGRYAISHVFEFRPGTPANLSDVESRLGGNDVCSGKFNEASVRWPRLGISGRFITFGAFADSAGDPITDRSVTGCEHRDQIQVSSLTATAPHWHTRQGLKIGDPLERLLELYPRAVQNGAVWWLHTIRSPFGDHSPEPDMTARVSGGAVQSITVIIGAQGD